MRPNTTIQEDPVACWWADYCGGDKGAFSHLAEHCYNPLYQYGRKFTDDSDVIKDCLQDLFLYLWEKREHLSRVSSPKSYLFQAFRNNLLQRIRQTSRFSENEFENDTSFSSLSPESEWIGRETMAVLDQRLQQGMELLPKRQREALYLRYYENLTYEEIAGVMGLRRQAVANYLQYGIQKLREYWQQVLISFLLLLLH